MITDRNTRVLPQNIDRLIAESSPFYIAASTRTIALLLLVFSLSSGCALKCRQSPLDAGPQQVTDMVKPSHEVAPQYVSKEAGKASRVVKPFVLVVGASWHIASIHVGGLSELDYELARSSNSEWAGFIECDASADILSGHLKVLFRLPGLPLYRRIPFTTDNAGVVSFVLPMDHVWDGAGNEEGGPSSPISVVVAFRPQSAGSVDIKSVDMRYFWSVGSGPHVTSLRRVTDGLWICGAFAGQPGVPLSAVFVVEKEDGSVEEIEVESCEVLAFRLVR